MAKKHMKKCSPSLAIKEMQIKTTLRIHLPLLEQPSSKTPPPTGVDEDVGKKGTLVHCWWECKLVQPLQKKIWRLLKNLNMDLAI
jgi:hypothetical protein